LKKWRICRYEMCEGFENERVQNEMWKVWPWICRHDERHGRQVGRHDEGCCSSRRDGFEVEDVEMWKGMNLQWGVEVWKWDWKYQFGIEGRTRETNQG